MSKFSQVGFSHILLLIILASAIGLGVYLVQSRTNFLPKAQISNDQVLDDELSALSGNTPGENYEKTGKLRVLHIDRFEKGKSENRYYFIEDESGEVLRIDTKGRQIALVGEAEIKVKGIKKQTVLQPDPVNEVDFIQLLRQIPLKTTGQFKIAVVKIEVDPNSPLTTDSTKLDDENLGKLLGSEGKIDNYYKKNSYGNIRFDYQDLGKRYIEGYFENCYEIANKTSELRDSLELDSDITNLMFIAPVSKSCPDGQAGSGTVGPDGKGIAVSWIFTDLDRSGIFAHEIGHNLGLDHAAALRCSDFPANCEEAEYGDWSDVMGATPLIYRGNGFVEYLQEFNGPHKLAMGWLKPSFGNNPIVELQKENRTLSITPLETGDQGVKVVKVFRRKLETILPGDFVNPSNQGDPNVGEPIFIVQPGKTVQYNENLYISYRQNDYLKNYGLSNIFTEGVSIHIWNELPNSKSKLIDVTAYYPSPSSSIGEAPAPAPSFLPGGNVSSTRISMLCDKVNPNCEHHTFYDPVSGVSITQISHNKSQVVVEIKGKNQVNNPSKKPEM